MAPFLAWVEQAKETLSAKIGTAAVFGYGLGELLSYLFIGSVKLKLLS